MSGINDYFLSKNPRTYHFGIDRGFLLSEEEGVSAPWPGLISVESQPTSKDTDSVYIDGERVLSLPPVYDETFLLKAYSYPKSFERFMGVSNPYDPQTNRHVLYNVHDSGTSDKFSFTYRTQGPDGSWVVHIYLSCTAEFQPYNAQTVNSNVNLTEYAWKITPNKVKIKDNIYTSHISVNTETFEGHPGLLGEFYRILYDSKDVYGRPLFKLEKLIEFLDFINNPTEYRLYMAYKDSSEWTLLGPKAPNYGPESSWAGIRSNYVYGKDKWTAYSIDGAVDETTGRFDIKDGPIAKE